MRMPRGCPQDAINFCDQPFCLIKVLAPSRFGMQRGQQNDTEGICPQIPETVRPDALNPPVVLLDVGLQDRNSLRLA